MDTDVVCVTSDCNARHVGKQGEKAMNKKIEQEGAENTALWSAEIKDFYVAASILE